MAQDLYIAFDIYRDIAGDIVFGRHVESREMLLRVIEKFRQKGAVSSDNAMTVEELGLPHKFKELMKGRLGRLGVFVEVDGKYHLSEERLNEVREQHPRRSLDTDETMFENSSYRSRHWVRHAASVPPGFLRYCVVKLLREKPMSGSEIMEEIGKETDGRWKPSPGSVYPLLAWLQDNGCTKKMPTEESGIKRYMLTEQGEKFFEEQVKLRGRLQEKLEFFTSPFFSRFWFNSRFEKLHEIREPIRRFITALFNLWIALEKDLTEQAIKEVGEILNENAEKIEEICKKIKEGN